MGATGVARCPGPSAGAHGSPGNQTSGRRGSHAAPDALGCVVELGARPFTPVSFDAEAIAGCSREHVEVDVEDLLERNLAVGQEQVHALTRKPRFAQRRGETLADPEHRHPELLIQVGQVRRVPLWDDKGACRFGMTRRYPSVTGWMSMKARISSSSYTRLDSTVPATTRQKIHPSANSSHRNPMGANAGGPVAQGELPQLSASVPVSITLRGSYATVSSPVTQGPNRHF